MKTFEFDANKYKVASTHQKEWGKRIISEMSIKGNESILDLGCGDGVLTKDLAELVPNGTVVGIDASENMIKKAKESQANNLTFIVMDIDAINFKNEFDIIFSNATLHWIKDHIRLLSNCYDSLKPSGIIRFNFAGDGNCSNFNAIVQQAMIFPEFKRYFENFIWPWFMPKIDDYNRLIQSNNFTEIKTWEENTDRYFATADDMTKWIDQPSLVPFLKVIGDKDKTSFRDMVVDQMIQKTKQPDGRCFETFRRINIFARK